MKQSFVFKNLVNRFCNTDFNLFLIGGAVRDLIFNQNTTTDFDLITNATIKEIEEILQHDFYFIQIDNIIKIKDATENIFIDIVSINDDELEYNLSQRDFIINSILFNLKTNEFVNVPNNFISTKLDLINPFYFYTNQTAIFRAIRISLQHNIVMSETLTNTISHFKLSDINKPKVFQELVKILQFSNGLTVLAELKILEQIIPDFKLTYNFNQNNKYHDLNLFAHINTAINNVNNQPELKLAMLFHDLGKIYTSVPNKQNPNQTSFYGHELKSAEIAEQWLIEYEAPKEIRQKVKDIILLHMSKNIGLEKLKNKVGLEVGKLVLLAHVADLKARLNINQLEIDKATQRYLDFSLLTEEVIEYNPNKPEMIILIGLPRSGKSSFRKKYYINYACISRDNIREAEFGFKGNMENEGLVTRLFNKQLTDALNKKQNIIIDNTNMQRKYRRQFIQQAQAHGYNIKAIVIDTEYEQVIINAKKEDFPIEVIESMKNRFAIPTMDEGYYKIEHFNTKFTQDGINYFIK